MAHLVLRSPIQIIAFVLVQDVHLSHPGTQFSGQSETVGIPFDRTLTLCRPNLLYSAAVPPGTLLSSRHQTRPISPVQSSRLYIIVSSPRPIQPTGYDLHYPVFPVPVAGQLGEHHLEDDGRSRVFRQ